MEKLQHYVSMAHFKAGTYSKLARKLKVNVRTLTYWRQGKGYPNEKTMLRLARYGKQDETEALLYLCYWRAKGRARKLYKVLLERMGG